MATITKAQYDKFNAQANEAGFDFDLRTYVIWGEKGLVKDIKQDDGGYIRYAIRYVESYKRFEKTVFPELTISRLVPTHTEGMFSQHIMEERRLGDDVAKKNFKALCELAKAVEVA